MPPAPVDPDRLLAVGTALRTWQDCARTGADEVLAHLVEVGDRDTQAALDTYLDTIADLLREIDASTSDLAARLSIAAAHGAVAERSSATATAPSPLGNQSRGPR